MNCPIKKTQYDSMIYAALDKCSAYHGQELTMVHDMTNAHQVAAG
jgi:hypothetical protein